jgi:hypothetical protein
MRRLTTVLSLLLMSTLLAPEREARADVGPSRGTGGVGISVSTPARQGGISEAGSSGVTCDYLRVEDPDIVGPVQAQHGGERGTVYVYNCGGPGGILWVPARRPAVAPGVLAARARRFLPLPAPRIQTSPPPGRDQLVGLRTWLWVDRATFEVRSATASVPGVSATVTAVPVAVTWTMGDGSRVVCRGPGTPYDPGRAEAAQQPSCAHTYRRSSAGQPGGRFTVTAATTWQLTWAARGQPGGGTLPPLARTSQVSLRVAEVQALNN